MADATYFHDAFYRFQPDAFNQVIKRFKTRVPDVTANCYYDTDQNVFCLTCPPTISPQEVDLVLGDVISDYISEELARAEREEASPIKRPTSSRTDRFQRPPNVQRFHPSCVDDLAVLTEPISSSSTNRRQKNSESLVLHSVQLQQTNGSPCVKLHGLNQLPDGFVERTLPSSEAGSGRAVQSGLTCRVVRWDAERRAYVFNGRVGQPISTSDSSIAHIFNSTAFLPLTDQRSPASMPERSQELVSTTTWGFKDPSSQPGIWQFLEGMGDMEPEEPNQKSEIPPDAQKFLSRANVPTAGSARARVAWRAPGVPKGSDDEASDDSSEEENELATETSFDGLLMGAKTNDEEKQRDSKDREEETAAPFESLFVKATTNQKTMAPPPRPVQSNVRLAPTPSKISKADELAIPNSINTASSLKDEASSTQIGEIPVYTRSYANIDNTGLNSSPANYAAWQLENMSPGNAKKKANGSGISRRQVSTQPSLPASPVPTSGSSVAMSLSTGPELQRLQPLPTPPSISSSMLGSTTVGPPSSTQGDMRPWTKKVIRGGPSPKKLIDDTNVESNTTVKLPPGLGPPPGLNPGSGRLVQAPQTQSLHTPVDFRHDSVSMSQSMVGFSDCEPASPTPRVKLPTTAMNKPMRQVGRANNVVASSDPYVRDDEDPIVERLQQYIDEPPIKRNTMRQKKGKGANSIKKKKASKAGNPRVELPKPDPIPPPRQRPVNQTLTASDSAQANFSKVPTGPSKSLRKTNDTKSQKPEDNGNGKDNSTSPVSAIQKLLEQADLTTDNTEAKIEVRFGMVLTRHTGTKEFHKGVYSKHALQVKLTGAANELQTTFFPRMTTSPTDAQYLLQLIPGIHVTGTVEYEIYIKNSEGSIRIVKFDQEAMENYVAIHGDSTLGTLYLHYPIHVWDAQVTTDKPELDDALMTSAAAFISSIQTTGVAPSFLAVIPPASFAIDKVHAKRTFTKKVSDSVELRVAEVRDLFLEAANSQDYNFKATALEGEAMIGMQRLWWECALHADSVDAANSTEFQGYVDDLVSQMDGVGFGNKGPWEKTKVEKAPESSAGSDQILW